MVIYFGCCEISEVNINRKLLKMISVTTFVSDTKWLKKNVVVTLSGLSPTYSVCSLFGSSSAPVHCLLVSHQSN